MIKVSESMKNQYIKNRYSFINECIEEEVRDFIKIKAGDIYTLCLFISPTYITVYKLKFVEDEYGNSYDEIYMLYNLEKDEFVSRELSDRLIAEKDSIPGLGRFCESRVSLVDRIIYLMESDEMDFEFNIENSCVFARIPVALSVLEFKMSVHAEIIDLNILKRKL